MKIIEYIIIFTIIGFVMGIFVKDDNLSIGLIIIISVLWWFAMGPWAIATFIELILGYSLSKKIFY
jgi:hypothetical protein